MKYVIEKGELDNGKWRVTLKKTIEEYIFDTQDDAIRASNMIRRALISADRDIDVDIEELNDD